MFSSQFYHRGTKATSLSLPQPHFPHLHSAMTGHDDFYKSVRYQGPIIVSQGPARSFSHRGAGPLGQKPRFLTPLPSSPHAHLFLSQPPEISFCLPHLLPYKLREAFIFVTFSFVLNVFQREAQGPPLFPVKAFCFLSRSAGPGRGHSALPSAQPCRQALPAL